MHGKLEIVRAPAHLVGLFAGDAGDDDDGVAGVAADGDARVRLLLGRRELALQGADRTALGKEGERARWHVSKCDPLNRFTVQGDPREFARWLELQSQTPH